MSLIPPTELPCQQKCLTSCLLPNLTVNFIFVHLLTLTHGPSLDVIREGTNDDLTLNLEAGRSYGMVGVCDQYCKDIDLKLYDPKGNLIDSDLDSSELAGVAIRRRRSGQFTLRVTMANCSDSPCYYGVEVFGQ